MIVTTIFKYIESFNTGRQYSVNGQRMAAGVTTDGKVLFADVDRLIYGEINAVYHKYDNLQWFVMYHYDRNNYTPITTNHNLEYVAAYQM